jgi:hypothetical protein
MTVTPIRTITMTSPTVTSVDINKEIKASKISNFSVASLLADTRSKTFSSTIVKNANLNNNDEIASLMPKNLSVPKTDLCSPNSHHDNDLNSNSLHNHHSHNNKLHHSDSDLLERKSHTPHSSIASDDFDDSMHDDDEEDSIVDVEDVKNDNSTNSSNIESPPKGSDVMHAHSLVAGQALIRPTPFSALAAAAAAWGMNNGVPGWPGRQLHGPPFPRPDLFPGQGMPGQLNGSKYFHLITHEDHD